MTPSKCIFMLIQDMLADFIIKGLFFLLFIILLDKIIEIYSKILFIMVKIIFIILKRIINWKTIALATYFSVFGYLVTFPKDITTEKLGLKLFILLQDKEPECIHFGEHNIILQNDDYINILNQQGKIKFDTVNFVNYTSNQIGYDNYNKEKINPRKNVILNALYMNMNLETITFNSPKLISILMSSETYTKTVRKYDTFPFIRLLFPHLPENTIISEDKRPQITSRYIFYMKEINVRELYEGIIN